MASVSIDPKQKKSKDSMYVYKFGGIGSRTPDYYWKTTTATTTTNKSKGWGSVLIRRSSKNKKNDNIHDHEEGVHAEKDMIKEVVVEEGTTAGKLVAPPPTGSAADHHGRKSALSSLDTIKLLGRNHNNNYIEGRKSTSNDQQVRQPEMKNNIFTRKDNNIGRGKKSGSSISDPVDKMMSLSKSSDDVLLGNKYHVEGRRSVSHVEKNMTYVGGAGLKSGLSVKISLKSEIGLLQVRVLVTDMPGFMQIHAFRCARRTFDSLENFSAKHMAFNLKKEFDKAYGPAWHCIVGSSFGSFVTHSTADLLVSGGDNVVADDYIFLSSERAEDNYISEE